MIFGPLFVLGLAATTNSEATLEQANQALMQDDQPAAVKLLERALTDDPANIDALWALSRLEATQGDYVAAVANMRKILQFDPYNDDVRYELAVVEWHQGDSAQAKATLGELLARHPQNIPALQLQESLNAGRPPPPPPSPWRPVVRADLAAGYDSNVALDPGTSAQTSRRNAALLALDLAGSLTYLKGDAPITLTAHLLSEQLLTGSANVSQVLPTVVEVGGMYSQHLGLWLAGVDARYQELFTNQFAIHRQREVAPALWAGIQLGAHRLRALIGLEFRQPDNLPPAPRDNLTGKLALRDEMVFRPILVLLDAGGRYNRGIGNQVSVPPGLGDLLVSPLYGFVEGYAVLYAKTRFWQDLALFGLATAEARHFDSGLFESTYQGQAGVQWTLGDLELHAEYAYTRNVSDAQRSFERHQVFAGVRVWYQ